MNYKDILSDKEICILKKIASTHNLDLEELGKLMSKKDSKNITINIRYSAAEVRIVDERADELRMKRSEYIKRCIVKAISDKEYMNINLRELKENTYKSEIKRDIRVAVRISNLDEYMKLLQVTKSLSMQMSSLIRDFSLSIKL